MKRIVFVNPPQQIEEIYGKLASERSILPTLGICHLAAVTREKEYETYIVDPIPFGWGIDKTVEEILKYSPDFVGITATTDVIYNAAHIAAKVKEYSKNIITIIGGPHITAVPENTLKLFPQIDIGVIGEGEDTIIDLLSTLDNESILDNVKGIIFRKKGEFLTTQPRPFIKDLDRLPLPAWDLLPKLDKYYRPSIINYKKLPSTSLITSRGCPGKCTFCDTKVFGAKYRGFSGHYVIRMIEYLESNYGIKDLVLYDDVFVAFKERLNLFCNYMMNRKQRITWNCQARINMVNYDMMRKMKQAGCWKIGFGIESGSQKVLDIMKKNQKVSKTIDVVNLAKKAGLEVEGCFIMGYIGEDENSLKETLSYIKKTKLDNMLLSFFIPFPGSESYNIAHKYGTFEDNWQNLNIFDTPKFIPNGLTPEKLLYYQKITYRTFYFRIRIIFHYSKRLLTPKETIHILKSFYAFIKFIWRENSNF